MILCESIGEMQAARCRLKDESIGFVPTMGALHDGHKSLIAASKKQCAYTIVSIFINPTQFGPNEDLDRYPKQLDKDIANCKLLGVDVVFCPTVTDMYPKNDDHQPYQPPNELTNMMCGISRPQFFSGVCNIVERLFNCIKPTHAFFGDKDLQQRIIIERMVSDLNLPIKIIANPIIRDENGLALSSRNQNLSPSSYKKALVLPTALKHCQLSFENGITDNILLKNQIQEQIESGGCELDYIDFFNPIIQTVGLEIINDDHYCCIAIKCDGIRLIDNCSMKNRI
jgi:pantoate--beta-alanine ligase